LHGRHRIHEIKRHKIPQLKLDIQERTHYTPPQLIEDAAMNYQNASLPASAERAGSTKLMNQDTVVPGILKKHLTPKGKWGHLVVESGSLQYVWEDDTENVLDADPGHPIVIFPERFHHVVITGPVEFKVEFYVANEENTEQEKTGDRPGEAFL
jgi:tellurite resistance-related uncharacterized protein